MLHLPPAKALPPPICDARIESLRRDLLAMLQDDQAIRERVEHVIQAKGLESKEAQSLLDEQAKRDLQNQERLQKLLKEHGWPRISQVGHDAAETAFLVIQHADLALQKRWFPAIQAAASTGEAKRGWAALLEDRILMREGQPQVYGSQITSDAKGKMGIHPIKDPERVDERRKAVGLEPLADYLKGFGLAWVPPDASTKPLRSPAQPSSGY